MTREQWEERFKYTHTLDELNAMFSEMEKEADDEVYEYFSESQPSNFEATVICEETWGDSAGRYAVREYSDRSYVLYENDTDTLTMFKPSEDPDEDIPFMAEDVLWSYGEDNMPMWLFGLYCEMKEILKQGGVR